jgi:hypothetical protein
MNHKSKKRADPIEEFMALPAAEKERVFAELEAGTPEQRLAESRPLNKKERALWRKRQAMVRRGRGRPRLGKEVARRVSITVESSLMDRVDAWAKSHGTSRSELVSKSLASFIGAAV